MRECVCVRECEDAKVFDTIAAVATVQAQGGQQRRRRGHRTCLFSMHQVRMQCEACRLEMLSVAMSVGTRSSVLLNATTGCCCFCCCCCACFCFCFGCCCCCCCEVCCGTGTRVLSRATTTTRVGCWHTGLVAARHMSR